MNLTSELNKVFTLPSPLSIFILINLISNIRPNNNEIIKQNRFLATKNINFQTHSNDDNSKPEYLIKRSAPRDDQNDDFMNSQIMKDLEMRLYQNQQQTIGGHQENVPNMNSKLIDQLQTPPIQQRQFMNPGSQSGYQGEPGRLPFNSLYPYIGSKFLSLFPRKTFHLNPYNPFPFLPNLIPSLSYMPYSSPSYSNPWSWGTNPYYSPFHYQYNNYNNRFSSHQPEPSNSNGGYRDYSTS